MEVKLKRKGEECAATWQFADQADIGLLQGWTGFLQTDSSDYMRDSVDFARQASARWRNYFDQGLTTGSWDDARMRSRESPQQEFSALLVLKAAWWFESGQTLAFAYVRRTWSAGCYLEFMAGHPMAEVSEIRGILRATLGCMAEIALATGGDWVWWEATKDSFQKYERIVGQANLLTESEPRVKDVFLVKAATLQSLLNEYGKPTVVA